MPCLSKHVVKAVTGEGWPHEAPIAEELLRYTCDLGQQLMNERMNEFGDYLSVHEVYIQYLDEDHR